MDYLHTTQRYERLSDSADRMARTLGWVSIGLGAAELLYGRRIGETLGRPEHATLLRGYGLREIGVGVMILMSDDPRAGIWARVAGDLLDLATLVPALDEDNPRRTDVRMAVAAVAAIGALDVLCAQALQARERLAPEPPDYSDRVPFPHGH